MAESPQVNHAAQPLDHKTAGDVSYAAHLSVAPMMDWTDRHCRYFHRLMSKQALLYTEMVTAPAVIHGDRARLLDLVRQSILWLFSWGALTLRNWHKPRVLLPIGATQR